MTPDDLVSEKLMRSIGLKLAYQHLVPFLQEKGGWASSKDVQDHLARIALQETTISVHAFFEKKNWAAFRNGISWANPNVWSATNQEKFGDALRVYVGDKTPKGQWDLLDEDNMPMSLSPAALAKSDPGLFARLKKHFQTT